MATNSLHSIQQHHHSLIKRHHPSSETSPPTHSTSLFLKPTTINTNITLSHYSFLTPSNSHSSSNNSSVTFSLSQTTSSTPSTSQTISFEHLRQLLSAKNFQQADEETRRLLIVLAGEPAQKRGYVFFSEVQFISETDLKTIDELWREHSENRFGYSVQKRIFEKAKRDFTRFFIKVRWMKKLDTEMEQYNYRSFPSEFVWELSDDTPEGHLPLTNALRGTQLLYNILNHPAFDAVEEEGGEDALDNNNNNGALTGLKDNSSTTKPLAQRIFKPDYSF
ncbi:tetrapyrrole-binding protein, chloroplastic [Gastrolobium bilobum]|uniref:tetrapyrrole-binding protein, chloroplastic n=1 Tax=Gastrolobium bilobum TaxID=150636 RepID=UPI002AAF75C6|nr:tetrapyrrole-binding protein, chloroplastic [Gastrolobium bilobum]